VKNYVDKTGFIAFMADLITYDELIRECDINCLNFYEKTALTRKINKKRKQ